MGNTECLEKINRLSVRIAKDKGENLNGSGVLFLRQSGQMPLIFTAAHVITKLFDGEDGCVCLHIGCSDSQGNTKIIKIDVKIVEEPSKALHEKGNIYIHSKYNKSQKNPVADIAMILVPWEEWMGNQFHFNITEGKIGEKLLGWGFPESMDQERKVTYLDDLIGKRKLEGVINNIVNNGTCSVEYNFDAVERNLSRSGIMAGFSGSGLFSVNEGNISLICIVSGECGDKCAGTMLWACSAECCKELMEFSRIDLGCPDSFERYKEMAVDYFPQSRKDARRLFADFSEELMEDYNLLPQNCAEELYEVLKCEGNRKWCDNFWCGKLKMLVMFFGSGLVQGDEILHPVVQISAQYENCGINIEYICTEDETETTLGQLIEEEYFSKQGNLKNGTIFVLNSKQGNRNLNVRYPKKECRQIIRDITNDTQYSERRMEKKIENLLPKNMKGFDIVSGVSSQCNLAAIGVNRMVDIMDRSGINTNKIKTNMKEMLKELWEE